MCASCAEDIKYDEQCDARHLALAAAAHTGRHGLSGALLPILPFPAACMSSQHGSIWYTSGGKGNSPVAEAAGMPLPSAAIDPGRAN